MSYEVFAYEVFINGSYTYHRTLQEAVAQTVAEPEKDEIVAGYITKVCFQLCPLSALPLEYRTEARRKMGEGVVGFVGFRSVSEDIVLGHLNFDLGDLKVRLFCDAQFSERFSGDKIKEIVADLICNHNDNN